jgi:tRNA/rRNA methyltransferase
LSGAVCRSPQRQPHSAEYNPIVAAATGSILLKPFIPSLAVKPWFANLRVVLVRARNPLNIGAAARAMSNFGFQALRLVAPWEPSFREASSAVGADEVMQNATIHAGIAEAVADCALVVGTTAIGERELQHPLQMLAEGAEQMRNTAITAPVALLFGSEKTGLSNEELSYCHFLMRIPTRCEHISMNLGQAVAVCLYELVRGEAERAVNGQPLPASAGQLEALTQVMMESLDLSGYLPKLGTQIGEEKVRRLLLRMNIGRDDGEAWLGMMRKILWKLKHPGE